MKLRRKITLYIIAILFLAIGSITLLSYNQMKSLLRSQIEKNLLNTAESVAGLYEVQNHLTKNGNLTQDEFYQEIETIRQQTDVDFIVVMDMKGIRYSHPVQEEVGGKFRGGDEKRVLTKGEEYFSEARGTLGTSLRVFVPIIKEGRQVGAVSVGKLIDTVMSQINTKIQGFIPFIMIGITLGGLSGWILAVSIKNTIFGMEPEEIALALEEKEVVLNNVKEGILAVDTDGRITLFNQEAAKILNLQKECLGENISEIILEEPNTEQTSSPSFNAFLRKGLLRGESLEDIEIKVKSGNTIMCKYNPLLDDKQQLIGAVINFRDLTELKQMAEELTGIRKLTWALRAQNHEFMNKLHTISGLIQLEEYNEAVEYISSTVNARNSIEGILTKQIKEVSLAALLFAKYNKAEEARIKLTIDPESMLTKIPEGISPEDLGSVLGNLIENSLDAVKNQGIGTVDVRVLEDREGLYITVKDNGPGISLDVQPHIYGLGVTSKFGQRGYGMYIVKKIIDNAGGSIRFEVKDGTTWYIWIPMKLKNNKSKA